MSNSSPTVAGTLYIVATPIGNLEDITLRSLRTLREVDLIAAEDTRHSRKLLSHYGISKPITSYYDHNQQLKGNYLLQKLADGSSVALISDAGTPCISDPGYQLVRDAVSAGIRVVPIPGPSAAISAVSASGLPTNSFTFLGFLPNRQGKRLERLAALRHELGVLVFYESPSRLTATLRDMVEVFGTREAVIGRELTKIHEEFIRGTLPELVDLFSSRNARGEIVILVGPPATPQEQEGPSVAEMLHTLLSSGGVSLKDAVQRVALATGLPRSRVYDEAVRQKNEIPGK